MVSKGTTRFLEGCAVINRVLENDFISWREPTHAGEQERDGARIAGVDRNGSSVAIPGAAEPEAQVGVLSIMSV